MSGIDESVARDWGNRVKGDCPACGRDTLFVGSGGWITCGWIGEPHCPNPTAVADIQEHGFDVLAGAVTLGPFESGQILALPNLTEDNVRRLLEVLAGAGSANVPLIFFGHDVADIHLVDEEVMRANGWVRAEA